MFARAESYKVGIRTFSRATEYLDHREMQAVLSLSEYFEGHHIRRSEEWHLVIMPQLANFLRATLWDRDSCELHLHVHLSVAFAAGYCLDSKTGINVTPVQRTVAGSRQWRAGRRPRCTEFESAEWAEEIVNEDGSDVALALSLTHDVGADVRAYVAATGPTVRRIVYLHLPGGPSSDSVLDGAHAYLLAEQVSGMLKTSRTRAEREGSVHIFAAAPSAFMFFLGRLGRSFGRCVLYEYDERNWLGGYEPSITFPNDATS